ncbi:MAG: response regulator [Leptolyngbya sp. Prado105]|jgi:DNA-binding response OmpR family regulator|nr:response regulator [Leptolyngbya sp. Prado105]
MNTILLIEDQLDLRDSLATMLKFEGYRAIEAENGEQGLHLAQQECPDLIVCEIDLPGLDGLSVLAFLRENQTTSHIPVIILTGNLSNHHHLTAIRLNISAYLVKPCPAKQLLSEIVQLLPKPQAPERSLLAA